MISTEKTLPRRVTAPSATRATSTHAVAWPSSTFDACGFVPPIAAPRTTIAWVMPKAEEAQRQIARLSTARDYADERDDPSDDRAGITSCMSLLGHFVVGPVPIPVASWTAGKGASLFLKTDGFYGDLEVEGDQIEYMISWTEEGGERQVFDVEKVDDGRLPPRLLTHLFRFFAKHDAAVL